MPNRGHSIALLIGCVIVLVAVPLFYSVSRSRQVILAGSGGTRIIEKPLRAEDISIANGRRPLLDYVATVNKNLFSSGTAPQPDQAATAQSYASVPSSPREPPADSGEYIYSGMARLGTAVLALIEEKGTGNGRFVRVGDRFGRGRVAAVTPDQVTVKVDGRTTRIARNQNYSLVPLSKSAPFLAARPAAQVAKPTATQAQPQPAQGRTANAQPTAPAGPTSTLPVTPATVPASPSETPTSTPESPAPAPSQPVKE